MATTLTLPNEAQAPPAPGLVEIDIQLTPFDMYRAERTVVWRQIRWIIMSGAAYALLLVLLRGDIFLLTTVAVLSLFLFAAHSGFLFMAARSMLRTSRVLRGTIHYSFEPTCLRSRGETFWSMMAWSNLHDVLETRQLFIIRTSSAQKAVIPKRFLLGGKLEKIRAIARKSPSATLTPNHAAHAPTTGRLNITTRLETEDLYQGMLLLLIRKSYWYAAQLVFSFVVFFAVNPNLLSPTLFVAIGSGFIFFTAISVYRASSRAIRTNAAYQNAIEHSFDAHGLEGSGPTFAFHHDWCNFRSVIEGSKIFLFCPSNAQMVVVPKRSFTDTTQINNLRQLLKTHFQGKLSLKY